MFNPEDPSFQRRTDAVNELMATWTVVGGTGQWLEAHLLARASYAGGLPQLLGCGTTAQEVEDLVVDAGDPVLLIVSDSIAPDHGVALMARLASRPRPPAVLLLITDASWLGARPLASCAAGAIVDVHSFGSGTVIAALQALRAGDRFLDPRLALLQQGVVQLSPREQEALQLLIAGFSNQQIAQQMAISVHTVRDYLSQVFPKLGVRNRAAAAAEAVRLGYDTPPTRAVQPAERDPPQLGGVQSRE